MGEPKMSLNRLDTRSTDSRKSGGAKVPFELK